MVGRILEPQNRLRSTSLPRLVRRKPWMRESRKMGKIRLVLWSSVVGALVFAASACQGGDQPAGKADAAPVAAAPAAAAAPAGGGGLFDDKDELGLAGAPLKGNPQAPVTIVEFSSYQCPFCSRVRPTLAQIATEFGDDVRLIFKQHPLPMQAQSRPAARAALAAHAQGKFWEFNDKVFDNQRDISEANLVKWAEEIGLDMAKFNEDRNAAWTNEQVDKDLAAAQKFNIRGTPNFLINGRNVAGAQPFDNFANAIREELTATRALIAGGKSVGQAFGERLEANRKAAAAQAADRPGEPDPNQKLKVPIGNSPAKGGADGLVTIVEFSSYQCPFCNRVRPTLKTLMDEYGDDLRVVFKHRPLGFQAQSEPAALAAIAAQNQGKFWEYHAGLFDNQGRLAPAVFEEIAQGLGLDMDKFKADMASDATKARLREDTSLADKLQAQGTPHFFINGYRLRGAQPIEAFKTIIERELVVAKKLVDAGTPRAQVYEKQQADAAAQPSAGAAADAAPAAPVNFDLSGAASRGPADAKVTVVEFSDFQCGFCGRLASTIAEVMPDYENRVRFVSMQFPLGRFPHSQKASEAALAANEQGKYWEYKKLIYDNQRELSDSSFETFAEKVGLDMAKFREALSTNKFAAAVNKQRDEGQKAGVRGTPALYINGRQVGGAIPAETLRSNLDEALAAAK